MQDISKAKATTNATPRTNKDIFTRDLNGELISPDDKDFSQILAVIENTQKLVHRLNTQALDKDSVRAVLVKLWAMKWIVALGLSRLFMWILDAISR